MDFSTLHNGWCLLVSNPIWYFSIGFIAVAIYNKNRKDDRK
jgi:hypothetical protein